MNGRASSPQRGVLNPHAAAPAPVRTLGIVNITEDSFSDGGKFLASEDAIAHAVRLAATGADIIDLGGAPSHPNAKPVAPELEVARLAPVVTALRARGIPTSVDSFSPQVQRWALSEGVEYLNDIQGFPFPDMYPLLAGSPARLIVMHSVQGLGPATRVAIDPQTIFARVVRFFEQRLAALAASGIARERLILDPGMGLFLGTRREASFEILRRLGELKTRFGLPVLVSVSRKSFLRSFIGRAASEAGAASLAAELYACFGGADFIRTHEPAAIKDALALWYAIEGSASTVRVTA